MLYTLNNLDFGKLHHYNITISKKAVLTLFTRDSFSMTKTEKDIRKMFLKQETFLK